MVELIDDWSADFLDIEEIDHETRFSINGTSNRHFHTVGMAMHAVAAVRRRHFGQPVRRFKGEGLCDFHGRFHKPETPMTASPSIKTIASHEFNRHRRRQLVAVDVLENRHLDIGVEFDFLDVILDAG
jgi:hypothetical protein